MVPKEGPLIKEPQPTRKKAKPSSPDSLMEEAHPWPEVAQPRAGLHPDTGEPGAHGALLVPRTDGEREGGSPSVGPLLAPV